MSAETGEDLVIRDATKDDLPRIWEIFREAFRLDTISPSELLGYLEKRPVSFLIGQIGDQVVGVSIAYVRDGRPYVLAEAVDPEFRSRRGVGSGLARQHFSNFQKWGYSEIDTHIRCSNVVAHTVAEKLGFKHVRTIRNFYDFPRGSARLYVKSLRSDGKVSIKGPRLRDRAKNVWGRVVEPRLARGLHVIWYDTWATVLDNALYELPEMENCPHDLFRLIMQNPSSARKRAALVIEGNAPVAVVGLRQEGKHWVPAMQGIVPGAIGPARDGFLSRSLRALRVNVRIEDRSASPKRLS